MGGRSAPVGHRRRLVGRRGRAARLPVSLQPHLVYLPPI